jgi:hypothetical protein
MQTSSRLTVIPPLLKANRVQQQHHISWILFYQFIYELAAAK